MSDRAKALSVLAASTAAFAVCFAVWMIYGVLVTYLVDRQIYDFTRAQQGWLIGVPVLSGSVLRLPAGMLTDRFGGRYTMTAIMLAAALALYGVSVADGFWQLFFGGLGLGVAGASFAAGVAYTSAWFPPNRQGTVLGIFGAGNAGAALTALLAPRLLQEFTHRGAEPNGWRMLPRAYALALVAMAVVFWLATFSRKAVAAGPTLRERLAPLASVRVWRFGLYYFLLFGGFVALSQWLIPYYVNVYAMSLVSAGALTSVFSLPAGLFRALGGWLSDRIGARAVMYAVLASCLVILSLLFPPRLELDAPGQGLTALRAGVVEKVSEHEIVVGQDRYALQDEHEGAAEVRFGIHRDATEGFLLLPTASFRRVPVVVPGDTVVRGQILVRGVTKVYFQANRWIFTGLVMLLGIAMGFGGGAVLKHVSTYFPGQVGTVGGVVGMLGALGGLVCPIAFGYMLDATGIWTTCWMLLAVIALVCLVWMHMVIRRMMVTSVPSLMRQVEQPVQSS